MLDHVAYTVRTVDSELTIKREAEHLLANGVGYGKARRIGTRQRLVVRILAAKRSKVASRKHFKPFERVPQYVAGHTGLTLSDPDHEELVA